MAYNSSHTGAEVDAATAWVADHPDELDMIIALRAGTGNCRLHPTTFNFQVKVGSDWHDLDFQDQGDSESGPLIVPIAAQTPDND